MTCDQLINVSAPWNNTFLELIEVAAIPQNNYTAAYFILGDNSG